jgi:hypothetical protein
VSITWRCQRAQSALAATTDPRYDHLRPPAQCLEDTRSKGVSGDMNTGRGVPVPARGKACAQLRALTAIRVCGFLVVASLCFGLPASVAAPPLRLSYDGLDIGTTPEVLAAWLARQHPNCVPGSSSYRASEGYESNLIASYDINRGSINECTKEGSQLDDSVEVTLAHPAVDPKRGAYRIEIVKLYPDSVLTIARKITRTVEPVRQDLFRAFGKPIQELRIEVPSSSANLARGLNMDQGIKREDYLVRYLWAAKGRLPEQPESDECDCGDAYVKAEIEISRSPLTSPKNQFYVTSLRVVLENSDVRRRQDQWNRQWLTIK